jgi:Kef-type K+ transport system membrane component KefB
MLLITLFVMTFIAHSIGLSIIIGAFLTGVIFDKTHIKKIQHEIYSMTYGLFIPIFFVYVGSFLTPATLIANWYLVLLIVLVASAGKFVGSFLGSSMSGTKLKDSAIIGIGMMGRCEVALIIAVSARKLGLFSADIYTIIVSSIILTVIIAPIMLRYVITKFSK